MHLIIIIISAYLYLTGPWIAGPARWGEYTADALGLRQSPIVVRAADAVYEQRLQENALKFHYTEMEACSLVNTGRSVQLNVPAAKCCMSSPHRGVAASCTRLDMSTPVARGRS